MNTIDLLRTAVQNTFRARLRTSLTVVALVIGAFTLTITTAAGTGVTRYITTQIDALGAPNTLTVARTATASTDGPVRYDPDATVRSSDDQGPPVDTKQLTARDITVLGRIPGVARVTPTRSVSPSWVAVPGGKRWQVTVNPSMVSRADLAAGAQLDDSAAARQVLLPSTFVTSLGFRSAGAAVGETVHIGVLDVRGAMHTVTATVAGVQNTTLLVRGATVNTALRTALWDAGRIGVPAGTAVSYTSATVNTAAAAPSADALDALKARLTDRGYTGQTLTDQLGTVLAIITGITAILDAFAVIALLAAGFGIVNTLLMSVQERTREIGLMKALGMRSGRIFALFSVEATFIGLLGSLLGAALAVVVGVLVSDQVASTLLTDLPGLQILQFSPTAVAVVVLVVMAIAFSAGTLPARRAARQDPIEALRHE